MSNNPYIDRLDIIATNALKDSLPLYNELVAAIKELIAAPNSTRGLSTEFFLAELSKFNPSELMQKLSLHFYDVLHTCDALGRSNVADSDVEASKSANIAAKEMPEMLWFVCDDAPIKISFDLVPKEALKYLQEK